MMVKSLIYVSFGWGLGFRVQIGGIHFQSSGYVGLALLGVKAGPGSLHAQAAHIYSTQTWKYCPSPRQQSYAATHKPPSSSSHSEHINTY